MKKNSIVYGTVSGILFQFLSIIFAFLLRTVMISKLGNEYIGLITVYSSIAGLLTSLDGGMASSVFIKIHKPLADNDENEIKRVYNLIRIIYFIRAALMFIFSFFIIFFLPKLTKEVSFEYSLVYITFLLYMIMSSVNVYVIYKKFMLEALQIRYISNVVSIKYMVLFYVLNIIQLFIFRNFLLYIVLSLCIDGFSSIKCNKYIVEKYPYLGKKKLDFKQVDLRELFDMSKIMLHTLSDVVVRNSDNLIVSNITNIKIVGMFSNYRMIIINLENVVLQFLLSIKDPLRNRMAVTNDMQDMKEIHNVFTYLCFVIANVTCVGIVVTINDLIGNLWLSDKFVLPVAPIFFMVSSIFLHLVTFPIIDAYFFNECYMDDTRTPIFEIFINIVVSIILGKMIGLAGVFIGTFIYQIYRVTKRSYVYYRDTYKETNVRFLINVLAYFVIYILCIFISLRIFTLLNIDNVFILFISKVLLTIAVCAIMSTLLCVRKIRVLVELMKKRK